VDFLHRKQDREWNLPSVPARGVVNTTVSSLVSVEKKIDVSVLLSERPPAPCRLKPTLSELRVEILHDPLRWVDADAVLHQKGLESFLEQRTALKADGVRHAAVLGKLVFFEVELGFYGNQLFYCNS